MSEPRPGLFARMGSWAWSFVGLVVAGLVLVVALAGLSEIVLPLVFAGVLAVVFKPAAVWLERHRVKPTIAAGGVVLVLLGLLVVVATLVVRGVTSQTDEIGAAWDAAVEHATTDLNVDPSVAASTRDALEGLAPGLGSGFLTQLFSGIGTVVGIATGIILGALIMYYLLKDGTRLRAALVRGFPTAARAEVDSFVADSCQVLRSYGRGRTSMAVLVALVIGVASLLLGLPLVFTIVVANFVGGYIPYIGAFLGGGLAVVIALGNGGLGDAAIMLLVVLAANLLLENFVEPKVMGRTLDIHPLVVIVVTALGGIVGGIVGLILAVPATLIAVNAVSHLRSSGYLSEVADRAEPTVRRVLG